MAIFPSLLVEVLMGRRCRAIKLMGIRCRVVCGYAKSHWDHIGR